VEWCGEDQNEEWVREHAGQWAILRDKNFLVGIWKLCSSLHEIHEVLCSNFRDSPLHLNVVWIGKSSIPFLAMI
jgi:hypothetical protein